MNKKFLNPFSSIFSDICLIYIKLVKQNINKKVALLTRKLKINFFNDGCLFCNIRQTSRSD